MNLYTCKFNKKYKILKVNMCSKEKSEIYSLGVFPGIIITKLYKSLFSDPVIYEINLSTIVISNESAKCIEVIEYE